MYGVSKIDVIEEVALISFNGIPLHLPLLPEIFQGFADEEIVIDMISQTAPVGDTINISFTCMDRDIVKVLQLSKELGERHAGIKPMVTSGNCKLQLYGAEMRTTHGVFARLLTCLSGLDIGIKQITTSEVDISLLVGAPDLDRALEAVRKGFQVR